MKSDCLVDVSVARGPDVSNKSTMGLSHVSFAPCGLVRPLPKRRRGSRPMHLSSLPLASATIAAKDSVVSNVPVNTQVNTASATASAASAAVPIKPASDVVAGAVARAASQSTIHPLDTLKVRLQTSGVKNLVTGGLQSVTSLYKGVAGAACGANLIAHLPLHCSTLRLLCVGSLWCLQFHYWAVVAAVI